MRNKARTSRRPASVLGFLLSIASACRGRVVSSCLPCRVCLCVWSCEYTVSYGSTLRMPEEGVATTWSLPAHLPALPVLLSPGKGILYHPSLRFISLNATQSFPARSLPTCVPYYSTIHLMQHLNSTRYMYVHHCLKVHK
jgi:hypothetical protein